MRTNYVLIDYENVQPADLASLDHEHFKIKLFVGANQAKIGFEIVSVLQRMGERAEYIKIAGNGPNALDFHIAFYIGHLVGAEPTAYFHIISKDAGFDPLIQHLKCQKILVSRSSEITGIPIVRAAYASTMAEKIAVIIDDLRKRAIAKPRTVKTLSSTVNALFQKQLSEEHVMTLLHELQKRGVITIQDTKIVYTLPQ